MLEDLRAAGVHVTLFGPHLTQTNHVLMDIFRSAHIPDIAVDIPMLIGAVDYFPRHYGEKIVEMARAILEGQPMPPAVYTDHLLLTADNVSRVYPDDKLP